MKIESSNNDSLTILEPVAVRATSDFAAQGAVGAVQKSSATNTSSSTVSLSTPGMADGSDIDTAMVESMKTALRDGSYKIDSSKIADGMLSTARDLLLPGTR